MGTLRNQWTEVTFRKSEHSLLKQYGI